MDFILIALYEKNSRDWEFFVLNRCFVLLPYQLCNLFPDKCLPRFIEV